MGTLTMLRAFSFGGGVQSTACLVLAARGEIDFPVFLFANTGEDSENPDTLEYIRRHAAPYAAAHGIEYHEVRRKWKNGRDWTLYRQLTEPTSRSIGIPVRMSNGAPGNRACTEDYKIKVIAKWLRERGATKENKALVALGISLDEFQRMRKGSGIPYYDICYPLIDLRIGRATCQRIITEAGLPVPPKSSCYFCPFHSLGAWRDLKQKRPDLFERSVALEKTLNERRAKLGLDEVYLTRKLVPLDRAVGDAHQFSLFDDDACESGYCMI